MYQAPINGPNVITRFDDYDPIPYGYTRTTQRRKGFIIGGGAALGASYLMSLFLAQSLEITNEVDVGFGEEGLKDYSSLYIPVIGPFLQLAESDSAGEQFWIAQVAAGQAVGAILLVVGLTQPRTVLVRNDLVSITPMISNHASGMMVSGRF